MSQNGTPVFVSDLGVRGELAKQERDTIHGIVSAHLANLIRLRGLMEKAVEVMDEEVTTIEKSSLADWSMVGDELIAPKEVSDCTERGTLAFAEIFRAVS